MSECNEKLLKERIKNICLNLRTSSIKNNSKKTEQFDKVIFTEERNIYLNKEKIKRLVVFLRGTGCYHALLNGGCTFCGFFNATNFGKKIDDKFYINQINNLIIDNLLSKYHIICLYNDGSLLCEEEISFNVLNKIFFILNKYKNIKKIILECRLNDIAEEKIKKLATFTDKNIDIAVGFESADPKIRFFCVNKEFDNKLFHEKYNILKKYNINMIPLLILKPPFLTEQEAIDDFIKSLFFLEKYNFNRIDIELPTIQQFTLVHKLWESNLYKPISLWSVIEILKLKKILKLKTPIYISPMNYSVESKVKSFNCHRCSDEIYELFELYNQYQDADIFHKIICECKDNYDKEINGDKLENNLIKRINYFLDIIESKRS